MTTIKDDATRETRVSRRNIRNAGPGRKPGARPPKLTTYGYWWWAAPAVIVVLLMIWTTTASGAFFAFTNWIGIGPFNIVGFSNFEQIFSTPSLLGALGNTIVLAVGFLVFTNVFGILFALSLNRGLKSRYVLRVLIFMPVVISPIAVSYMWSYIFDYKGPLNQLLQDVGLGQYKIVWLANPKLALVAVLVVLVWQNIGLVTVIYLAGLATVPQELEEAAALDGAGVWSRFRHIVLPSIQPSLAIATTLMLIQGLRVFDQVMALTDGGPYGATETLATQVYKQTFVYGRFGFGAALALVLTVIILIFTIVQQYITRDRERSDR